MTTPNFANRTFYKGDNLEFLQGMNCESIDLIATDPPFNTRGNRTGSAGSYEDNWKWLKDGERKPDQWHWENVVHESWLKQIRGHKDSLYEVIETTKLTHGDGTAAFLCFLGIRLLEMHRILKPTGSIYLHCDHKANAYIRMAMDAIFGRSNFRNEIVWRRYGSHNDATTKWGNVHDTILFYSKSSQYIWTDQAREPLDEAYVAQAYRYADEQGPYTTAPLHARGLSGGGNEFVWRGIYDIWRFTEERLEELDKENMIHWPMNGRIPRRKVYLDRSKGIPARDLILNIGLTPRHEKTGSPDQKPLALYERFIRASSNIGDWVLDPFCGCATTPVAAENLKRKWVGIDRRSDAEAHILNRLLYTGNPRRFIPVSKSGEVLSAERLLEARRLSRDMGLIFPDVPPVRSDDDETLPSLPTIRGMPPVRRKPLNYDEMKEALIKLFGYQCWGCDFIAQDTRSHKADRYLELDHIEPETAGGSAELHNRALLCRPCNRDKREDHTILWLRQQAGYAMGRSSGAQHPIDLRLAKIKVAQCLEGLSRQDSFRHDSLIAKVVGKQSHSVVS